MASSSQNNASKNDGNCAVSACTQKRGNRVKCKWTIKRFHQLPQKNGEGMYSPAFPKSKRLWKLQLYPQGFKEEDAGCLSALLWPASDDVLGIEVMCDLTVIQSKKVLSSVTSIREIEKMEGYKCANLVQRSELSIQDDPTDSITIHCKIKVLKTPTSCPNKGPLFEVRKNGLSRDFASLYGNPTLSDFTIISGDKKFLAHKAILASRSPVFAAMFQPTEVNGDIKNERMIKNVESAVVEKLLEFIYTDDVSEIGELAEELLVVAEKYALEDLKNLCEKTLFETINADNAEDLLEFADSNNADHLKEFIIQYIADHHESFKTLGLPLDLLRDVLPAVFSKMDKDSTK